ncbi:alpha/beta hydrolase [Corynebacterium glyciniphilum]|uniref:RBBP9/YdeN family alpha/beta hydrolase n=1 Tax=Corynebacterium glyciniphilum TaxID=1404244 RepID=UPI002354BEE9
MVTGTTPRHASIIHGYAATPQDHWFGWLAERLRSDGIPTAVPALPNSLNPHPVDWTDAVHAAVGKVDENSVIVAHSLGCLTVLRYLRALSGAWRVGTLVLVSGFVDTLPALPDLDDYIADGCDVTGLDSHVDQIVLLRSDNDPLVPAAHTDRLAELLGTPARIVPGAGHFLASDGVTSLPEILEVIGQ